MWRSRPTVNGLPGTTAVASVRRLAWTSWRPSYICAHARENRDRNKRTPKKARRGGHPTFMALLTIGESLRQRGQPFPWLDGCSAFRMRKFLVIAVLLGLGWLFLLQKRAESQKSVAANKP